MKRWSESRSCILSRTTQLGPEQVVELRRIRLALGGLHDLADEETEKLVLAGPIVGELFWIGGDDGVDHSLDGAGVGDLLQAPFLDDVVRALAFGPHGLEYVFGDFPRNGRIDDARQQAAKRSG